ncbi:hypothetical protein [Flindersiella endophytica]
MRAYPCGDGTVEVDDDGLVVGVKHRLHPALNAVLDSGVGWFGPEWRWGTGLLITDAGSGRFARPASVSLGDSVVSLRHEPVDGLVVETTREFGESWRERYVLRNTTPSPVTVGSFAVTTPIRDVYGPAKQVLLESCHAHVWTGGAESWLVAIRMDGAAPVLALDLTEGELWAYSVAGRHIGTSSNVRGVLQLHATDHARAPHAFGGQPELALAPGEELALGWEIGWTADVAAALGGRRSTIAADVLAAATGTPISLHANDNGEVAVESGTHGITHQDVAHADGRRSRVAVLHHTPLAELVGRRVEAVLRNHRAVERDGSRAAAFVPYDTSTGLRLPHDLGWADWNDARERVGMAHLLLTARAHGWLADAAEADRALLAYKGFCVEHIVRPDGRVRDSSTSSRTERLYNNPWFAQLFAELFTGFGDPEDLTRAVAILDAYYEDGGEGFLAIGVAEAVHRVAGLCSEHGRTADADRLRGRLVSHGLAFAALGSELPAHEVAYEQSMVAPLLSILEGAWRISPEPALHDSLRTTLPWLLAFAGRQPHVRLRNVSIRHWDGYWFGKLRLWGDTFPHYWSVLSARALRDWPADVDLPAGWEGVDLEAVIRDVCLANLADFTADGGASCAFVFPSAIDDLPGYVADPLANDQDWALTLMLRPGLNGEPPLRA